jgi:hypothetical protein
LPIPEFTFSANYSRRGSIAVTLSEELMKAHSAVSP